MNFLRFIYPALDSLSEGSVVRKIVAVYLRVQGILLALAGLAMIIMFLKAAFAMETEATLAGVLIAVVMLAGFWFIFQVHFYRAGKIQAMEDSPYTIIPIISNYFRLIGEVYAIIIVAISLSGFVSIVFTRRNSMGNFSEMLEFTPFGDLMSAGGSTFFDALLLLIVGAAMAFFVLLLFYFLAEVVIVQVDIALNTRRMAGGGRQDAAARDINQGEL